MIEDPKPKLTQTIVSAALKRKSDGKFTPKTLRDHEVAALMLIVGTRRATWCVDYKPHGTRQDGHRHSKVRMTLGDATTMPLPEARTAARAIKVEVAQGRDPHAEKRADRAKAIAARAVKPTTLAEAVEEYSRDMLKRRQPSEATRRQEIHYSKKAIALMEVGGLAVDRLDAGVVRALIRTMDGSAAEVRHAYGALSRFCGWMVEETFVAANVCEEIPRKLRPKPGKDRGYVPPIAQLRAIWEVVADEDAVVRDLVRFMLLTPVRRDEAAGLEWGEVDLDRGWIAIGADRMKNREVHELPLSEPAQAIIKKRKPAKAKPSDLVFPSGERTVYSGWTRLLTRIRKAIGQGEAKRDARYVLHDNRRSFTTLLAERFDENLLDLMIAHRPASRRGSGAAYQKAKRLNERPAVMTAWARMVLDEEQATNVVPLIRSA